MSGKYLLAIDQGTSSSRAVIYDHNTRVVSSAQQEFPQIYPQPGWVEHDPEAIWASVTAVTAGAIEKVSASAADISAIGITNQRETTLSGTVTPASASTTPSSGRIAAQPNSASRCSAMGSSRW